MSLPLDACSHRRDSLDSLEKQLICPICLEIFTKPVVILPCLHNLCRKCANNLYQVGVGGRFCCPSCRHEVVLDRHGVYGLQRNLLVENIIDVYKQESASSNPPPKPPAQLTCEEHHDEKLNIYCITCQVPSCSLCKVFGAHQNCQVAPLSDVYEQQKSELSEGVASLVSTNDSVQAFINELEEVCRNIEENSRIQKQILCEKFDRMSAILEERQKIMTQKITYEEEEKAGWAQSLVQTYSGHVDTNSNLVQAALNAMEEPEMAAFVQTSKDHIEKVSKASTCVILETLKPGYENMDHYKVDFNAEERVLYQLDFMKLEEEVEDTPDEPKSDPDVEPECERVPTPKPDSEPDLGIKLEGFDMSPLPETIENTWGQEEVCADAIKEPVYERNGFTNQQSQAELAYEDHDATDLGIQSSSAEAGEEALLYPSWYMSNSWQVISSSLAKSIEVSGGPNNQPQHVEEPDNQSEFQQPRPLAIPSRDSLTAENQTSQPEESCLDDKPVLGFSLPGEIDSELAEDSADGGGGSYSCILTGQFDPNCLQSMVATSPA